MRLGELKLPERLKSSRFDPEKAITLRCGEVFANPQPSIDVARLAEIAPEDIAPDFLHAGTVPINAALLALRYHFIHTTEQIEVPVIEAAAVQPDVLPALEVPAPARPLVETAEASPVSDIPDDVAPSTSAEQKTAVVDAPPASPDIPPPPALSPEAPPVPKEALPAVLPSVESTPPMISVPSAPAPPARASMTGADPADSAPVARPRPTARIPDKRTIFNILPALRRQSTIPKPSIPPASQIVESDSRQEIQPDVDEAKTSEPPPPAAVESPVKAAPTPEAIPAEQSQPTVEEPAPWEMAMPSPPPAEQAPIEPEPPAAAPEPQVPAAIHIERLPPTALKPIRSSVQTLESVPDERLASQDRLQEIFMTEDQLTLDQVLKLCGGLPGIRSCILTKGSSVLSTFNVPEGIDLVSLTGNASAMLDAMRASSMRMGLGAIPAVTVHSEKGPVSFFHSDDLAMLIIHSDRGFIPGVREKLHDVVVALGQSNLPLTLDSPSAK